MRQQAKKANRVELAYLSYWRSRGFFLGVDDDVPLNTITAPDTFIHRHPILDALLGLAIIAMVVGAVVLWVARGAGLI
ncbi:hypothetical protein [Pseudomonas phage PPpW-3]|uniref:Uncharacterized protein n=1 Tax=Pseudomonas phage PPpW-3 TaxID=1279082 RepID=V5YUS3_9CAUD|nr:hypothetical protein X916_gp56 [Pseudomonas phage PPpW-3]BAO20656.1 hypothetical protein [Pseudomonas phage PPpW-3]